MRCQPRRRHIDRGGQRDDGKEIEKEGRSRRPVKQSGRQPKRYEDQEPMPQMGKTWVRPCSARGCASIVAVGQFNVLAALQIQLVLLGHRQGCAVAGCSGLEIDIAGEFVVVDEAVRGDSESFFLGAEREGQS